MEVFTKLGGRKFVLSAISTALLFLALFLNKLEGESFVAALALVVGIYTGGNVGSKFAYNNDTRTE